MKILSTSLETAAYISPLMEVLIGIVLEVVTLIAQSHSIKDIKMHSLNNQIIFVASDKGLYKSIDGGINLNEIMSGDFQEIEFHPIKS